MFSEVTDIYNAYMYDSLQAQNRAARAFQEYGMANAETVSHIKNSDAQITVKRDLCY